MEQQRPPALPQEGSHELRIAEHVSVRVHRRNVDMRFVSDSELRELASLGSDKGLPLSLFTLFAGVLATLIVATLASDASEKVFASFIAGIIACAGLCTFFAVMTFSAFNKAKTRLGNLLEDDSKSTA